MIAQKFQTDAPELIARLSGMTRAELAAMDDASLRLAADVVTEMQWDRIDAHCKEDVYYWLCNHTMTENEKWKEQGREFRAKFPQKSYFPVLFETFREEAATFVPKSRDMMTSWAASGFGMHEAQWEKACVVIQTLNEDKAKKLVKYCNILYENQPAELKERHPMAGTSLHLSWKDGGEVFGIPAGEDQIRMHHPTLVIFDEAGFLPGFQVCYDTAKPVAAKIIAISTANMEGFFAVACQL